MNTESLVELSQNIPTWENVFTDPKMIEILKEVEESLKTDYETKTVFPPKDMMFNAFHLCSYPPKVIILGQDPYHSNVNEAMGLAFSVPHKTKIPPSLRNIYKELKTDIPDFEIPNNGDLTKWATQGVLLLNTALTVVQKKPKTHVKIWKKFTTYLLNVLSENPNTVFMLWGNPAKAQLKNINVKDKNHELIFAVHPSPLSASRGWFGSKCFSQCNKFLNTNSINEIDWTLHNSHSQTSSNSEEDDSE